MKMLIKLSDEGAIGMGRAMAVEDFRSLANFVAWLIRQEYARRYSQPNPLVTIREAQIAADRVMNGEEPRRSDQQGF